MGSIHEYEWLQQYKELLRKVLSSKRKRFQSSAYVLWESNNMKWLTEKLRTQNIKIANKVEWKVLQFYNAVKIEFHIISECRWLRQNVDFLWHNESWHASEKYFFFTSWIHISLDHITLLLSVNHSASWYRKLSPEEVSFPLWTVVSRHWVQSSFDMIIQCTSTCNFSMKKQGLRVKGISFLNCLKKHNLDVHMLSCGEAGIKYVNTLKLVKDYLYFTTKSHHRGLISLHCLAFLSLSFWTFRHLTNFKENKFEVKLENSLCQDPVVRDYLHKMHYMY